MNEEGWAHAGGELVVGDARLCFLVDLSYWTMGAYQHQWRQAIARLVEGAPSTAFMTAYRGPGASAHIMWALWRDNDYVYVQEHSVLPADLDAPFDPNDPYPHIGERVPAAESGLPIPEWHIRVENLHASLLGVRLPKSLG